MSAKLAEAESRPGRRAGHPWSLVARLATSYTIASSVLLTAALMILHSMVMRHVDDEDSRFLIDKLHTVQALLGEGADALEAILPRTAPDGSAEYSVRVVDSADGRILFETSPEEDLPPPAAFPPPPPGGELPETATRYEASTGNEYFLVSALGRRPSGRETPPRILIAQNRSDDVAVARKLRRLLAWVVTGGLLAVIATSWLVTRRGLRPLEEMRNKVAAIGSSELDKRLGAGPWPAELVSLVTAFDGMLSRLEDAFDRLSRFSADIAHELRTPIQNLRGEAEVALNRPRSEEEYREVIGMSIEECERMAGLVDSLLFLARAENEETRLQSRTVDLAGELDKIVDYYGMAAEDKGIRISRSGEGSVEADPLLLGRAVGNLVANALAYTGAGGTIALTVKGGDTIEVSDSGAGIDPPHLDRVFDRFYRADPSRTGDPPGAGLGLAIVKSIMELHGGSVGIDSETGRGTRVTLRFRAAPSVSSSPPQ